MPGTIQTRSRIHNSGGFVRRDTALCPILVFKETQTKVIFITKLATAAAIRAVGRDTGRSVWESHPSFPQSAVSSPRGSTGEEPWGWHTAFCLWQNWLQKQIQRQRQPLTFASLREQGEDSTSKQTRLRGSKLLFSRGSLQLRDGEWVPGARKSALSH